MNIKLQAVALGLLCTSTIVIGNDAFSKGLPSNVQLHEGIKVEENPHPIDPCTSTNGQYARCMDPIGHGISDWRE